ncbi:hypothetical protein [Rheinheimera sp. MM224]|uniref:hypothetical protein n=1 Tax=Rheinheimera sp. MM224 TaxID=3019969 RepID=UPI0021F8B51C|nr:hypothetical protein [Rheinheimera sp. MM224]
MKTLQILGNLIPILLALLAYYLFGDTKPNTPAYAGTALAMGWMGAALFAIGFVFVFVMPGSFMLLTKVNRTYFSFTSKGWLSVLVINWLLIGVYSACIVLFALTSVR